MKNIEVNNNEYSIVFSRDIIEISELLHNKNILKNRSYFIIDENVYNCHKKEVDFLIKNNTSNKPLILYISENEKNYRTIEKIYSYLIENNCTREGILVSIGGGVLGDLVGMVSATFMRGIKYINIPTTIISETDSSIGGKVAYNFNHLKNVIGAFYNPFLVIINVEFLKTLPERQFNNGIGEVIKYTLIDKNQNLFKFFKLNKSKIKEKDSSTLEELIRRCLLIKKIYVEEDFKDNGLRNILNFGHTIGHGIESDSEYSVLHGEAVALGILVALKLSNKHYDNQFKFYEAIKSCIKYFDLPVDYKIKSKTSFIEAIKKDKKNDENIRFVLLKEIGNLVPKVIVSQEEIFCTIEETFKGE